MPTSRPGTNAPPPRACALEGKGAGLRPSYAWRTGRSVREVATKGHACARNGSSEIATVDGWCAIVLDAWILCICPRTRRYVADCYNHKIREIVASTGVVTTLAGGGQGYADGTGTSATFQYPTGLGVSPDGAKL